jgi:hypothetical protein
MTSICVYQPVPESAYDDPDENLSAYLYQDETAPDPREEWGADDDSPDVEYWQAGEVYGIVIAPTGSLNPLHDQIGSCWGFYGYDYAVSECATVLADAAYDRANQ